MCAKVAFRFLRGVPDLMFKDREGQSHLGLSGSSVGTKVISGVLPLGTSNFPECGTTKNMENTNNYACNIGDEF